MKRILLFTMMCLFGLFSLNAQETITIGEGSTTCSHLPLDMYNGYGLCQQMYTADEIGYTDGGTISSMSIKFYGETASSNPENPTDRTFTRKVSVYVNNTNLDVLSSGVNLSEGQAPNFDGTVVYVPGQWTEFVFDNPFVYEGGNIIITMYDYTNEAPTNYYHFYADAVDQGKVVWANIASELPDGYLTTELPDALYGAILRNYIQLTFAEGGEGGETPDPTPDPEVPTLDLTKQYRVKATSLDQYFYVLDNDQHSSGTNGGVIVYNKVEGDNNQLFTLEDAGDGAYYFKSANGYYIYCQEWNVDAYSTTAKTALKMVDQGDGTFYLQNTNNNKYFKVEQVGWYYYPFCDCDGSNCTIEKWTLEAVDNGTTPDPTPTVPAAPEMVYAFPNGTSSMYLMWSAVEGATSYKVYSMGYEIAEVTGTEYVVNYLQAGNEYCFSVTAVNENGESEPTEGCGTLPAALSAPQNLVATAEETSITLTWDAVDGAVDYYVNKGDQEYYANTSGATTFTDEDLTAGEYCYTVIAMNASSTFSDASTEACATIAGQGGETVKPENLLVIDIDEIDGQTAVSSSNYYLPVYDYAKYALSQQIYKHNEIGYDEGAIYSVSFRVGYYGGVMTRQYEVYMKNIEEDAFSGNNYLPLSADDKVYDGDVTLAAANEWYTIDFTVPFDYTGNNVLLCVYDKTGVGASPYHTFYQVNTYNRGMYSQGATAYDPTALTTGATRQYVSQVRFEMAVPSSVKVDKETIALGNVALGEYWAESEVSEQITITPVCTSVTSITSDNDFFVFPATIDYTASPIVLNVGYDKNAEAGEYTGNLTITYGEGETLVIPMTATAYEPKTADVFELAQELSFTEGVAIATPDFSNLNDNYNLPNEVNNGNTPDAVYTFTLTEEVPVTVNVTGTNAIVAIYNEDFNGKEGPTADNNYKGNIPAPTTFFYDFEDGSLEDFNLIDADGDGNNWQCKDYYNNVAQHLFSYSWGSSALNPDNYIVTKEKYLITESSKLVYKTMTGEADNYAILVSDDGENFVTVFEEVPASWNTWYDREVELGNYQGEKYIALRHYNCAGKYNIQIDNLQLTDGSAKSRGTEPQINAVPYPAGTYYLVAAAEDAFTVTVTAEGVETPTPSIAAPQNLVATEITQSSITLTWDAADGAEDYYVYKDGQMWANTSGNTTYTENGLAAGTEYCFAVQAVGAAGESELSAELCVETESIELAENEIVIGTATKNNYAPFCPALGSSHVEMIYKAEEIGKACTISEIAFSYYSGSVAEADIDIYLAETTKSAFSGESDVTAMTELTLVYSKTGVTICDEEWDAFVLDTPFNYSGENNLLVVATMNSNAGATAYVKWNSYSDPSSVIIKDILVLNDKPVMKLTLGEGGEGGNDEPAEITHRLVGIYQNEYNNVAYIYESETSNVVTEVVEGSNKTVLEYNEDGQIVKTTYAWVDPSTGEMDLSNYTLVTYTYENGVLVSYKEEIINSWFPSSTEYTFTYEEDFVVKSWPNAKETYTFEDGRLVEKSRYYYDQWSETPDFVRENMVKYEYDENGNCVTETQYSTYGEEPREQNGVDYYYDMTIAAENVATFAYPHEILPTHANLVTKALLYYYQEDWQTHEVSKSNFEVKTYNYSPEVVAAPFAPMELKANVVSDVEISLTWVSIEAAESFNVFCNGELAGNATETYFTVSGLTAATDYCFTVKGVSVGVESEASNEACATTMQLVNIVPNEIAFGDVKMGEFWAENPTGVEVKINLLGKTITSIATDNDFFRVPATINLTEEPVTFKVDYKKSAEAGEYTGNLIVTLSTEETVTIPLSATAYNPVAPDVFELAEEIEFVEGAYTDAPDFATLYDDYNLPNEAEGNNPDAVYAFTLDTESVVNVEVTGENAVYATYKAFGEEEGPTAANAFFGEETVLSTSFFYDFENADLSDFTIVDYDVYKDYTWTVEDGSLVSYSFVPTPDYSYPYYVADTADERIITNKAYAITANSVLTLDINVNGSGGNFNWGEHVIVEVTQDGETFTQVGIAYDDETTYSYEFMSKRINIGAKFAELGLEYGEYQIVLHHDQNGYGHISVDNLALTERANVYPAGTYYLVAAAPAEFEVNVEVAAQEMPVAPKAYRLVSKENHEATTYVYDATDVNRVVRIESDGTVEELEYNADGTLAGYKTVVTYEDPEVGVVEEEIGGVSYVYEDGRLVSYSELAQSWMGMVEITTEITYNAEGQVESVLCADYETVSTFVYNAEGLVSEMATGYLWDGEAIVDAKEVYTYENGKLVKQEYMAYDYFLDDGSFYLTEKTDYTYDANGNCVKAETFTIELDEETEEEVESLYKTVEYYYNTTVLAEDVYTFEYPHLAFTYPVKPAAVNVLTKDMSYMTGYDWDGNYGNHSHVLTVYGYDPEILSAPYAPFNLTAEATGATTVALTWEAYADAETFAVYNGTEKVAEGIEGFEYTVSGLKAATEYCFTVKAVNAAGESAASNEACATTEEATGPTVPAAPVITGEALDGAVFISWEAVEGATHYQLYYAGNKLGGLFVETSVNITVQEAGTYCFTVTAFNEVGESEHSNEVCVTVEAPADLEVPAAPVVTATLTDNKVVLTWDAVEGATYYTIYQSGVDQPLGSTLETTSPELTLPEPGIYCFTVTASNLAGESEHSEEVCVEYGVGIEENVASFNIYPNPVENMLFIETEAFVEEVSIYTVTGTLIYKEVDFNSNTIDVSEFNGGVYIMKVRTEAGEIVKRFVKK